MEHLEDERTVRIDKATIANIMEASRSSDESIIVGVRIRPLFSRDGEEKGSSGILGVSGDGCCALENPEARESVTGGESCPEIKRFQFDYAYSDSSTQEEIFRDIGAPLIENAMSGFNSTIFAYGQTGSGKTHTMYGSADDAGISPRIVDGLFNRIETAKKNEKLSILVQASYFEIYNEKIRDLLVGDSAETGALKIKEHALYGVYVQNLSSFVCGSEQKVSSLLSQGNQLRSVGATLMNEQSSRSHSIFTLTVNVKGDGKSYFSKINLVDLAGSERVKRTGARGGRLTESVNINKSLSSLGQVINALAKKSSSGKSVFIPYRNSKLTRVLQESLGGNSKCTMIACASPASASYSETMSTLAYANRAKNIKVKAVKNDSSILVDRLKHEVASLKQKLADMEREQRSNDADDEEEEDDRATDKYNAKIAELGSVIESLNFDFEEKKRQSSDLENQILREKAEREALMSELEATEKSRTDTLSELAALKDALDDAHAALEVAVEERDLARETEEEFYEELRECEIDRNYLRARVRDITLDLKDKQAEYNDAAAEVSKLRAEMDARRSSISVPEEAHKLIILRSFMETMCATLAQEGNSGDRSPRDLNEQQLCAALKGHIERLLLGESAAVVASPSKRYLEDALRYAQSLSET